MGEHSRHLGRGFYCAYCGEAKVGEEAKTVRVIDMSDSYYDDPIVLDPNKSVDEQILAWAKAQLPQPSDQIKCPACGETCDPEWGDLVNDELWQCTDCEEICVGEDDAEACCSYNRRYVKQNQEYAARHRAQAIEDAQNLLRNEGFHVLPKQDTVSSEEFSLDDIIRRY